jgi:hypothetical protein
MFMLVGCLMYADYLLLISASFNPPFKLRKVLASSGELARLLYICFNVAKSHEVRVGKLRKSHIIAAFFAVGNGAMTSKLGIHTVQGSYFRLNITP